MWADLDQAIDQVEREEPRAVVVASGKPRSFIAGADLFEMRAMSNDELHRYLEEGQRILARLERLPDALLDKYAPELAFDLSITPEVRALIPAGSMAGALALVECYQRIGRPEEAVGILQQLILIDDHRALVVSLCELLMEAKEWEEVVELTDGTTNEGDVTLQLLLDRARALSALDDHEAALALFDDAVSSKRRSDGLLVEARYWRAREHALHGDAALGRAELERLYEEDPEYRDVASLVDRAG